MKVQELMTHPAHTCTAQDSLEVAARQLWEHDCGVLPVLDAQGRVQAVITDRDICMGAYTRGARLADLRVADSMSRTVSTCRVDDDIAVAARTMIERAIRRLPVVDGDGRVRGVLSLNDLARAAHRDKGAARDALSVLVAACGHRLMPAGNAAARPAAPAPLTVQPVANPRRAAVLESSKLEAEC